MAHETDTTIDPHFKVRNSPLQGVEAYRSPYYRRLLSAGYKGYLQGSLGGATLFGLLGAAAGFAFFGVGVGILGASASAAFLAVPIMTGAGLMYGKDAFGTIGAVAAVSAEQAELSEKRRNLLDRYFETPSVEEAKEIERQLSQQAEEHTPERFYHWKSGLLGAAVVAITSVIGFSILAASGDISSLSSIAEHFGILDKIISVTGGEATATGLGYALAAGIGAAIGSVVGIDRSYVRKWFDFQENLHDTVEGVPEQVQQHAQSVNRLRTAFQSEGYGQENRRNPNEITREAGTQPIPPRIVVTTTETKPTASLERQSPSLTTEASGRELHSRMQATTPHHEIA